LFTQDDVSYNGAGSMCAGRLGWVGGLSFVISGRGAAAQLIDRQTTLRNSLRRKR